MFNDIVVRGMMITVEQPPVHLLMQLEEVAPMHWYHNGVAEIASRIEGEDQAVEVVDTDDGYDDGVVWQAPSSCRHSGP